MALDIAASPIRASAVPLFAGSGALLAGALAFQHLGGLHPCELCLYQRVPHAAVLLLAAGAALAPAGRERLAAGALALAGAALLAGAGIAGFHVGVEQRWWEGTAGCGATATAATAAELRAQLLARPVVRCDEVAWSLFGISMAGYNMVASAGLAVFALLGARAAIRPDPARAGGTP